MIVAWGVTILTSWWCDCYLWHGIICLGVIGYSVLLPPVSLRLNGPPLLIGCTWLLLFNVHCYDARWLGAFMPCVVWFIMLVVPYWLVCWWNARLHLLIAMLVGVGYLVNVG